MMSSLSHTSWFCSLHTTTNSIQPLLFHYPQITIFKPSKLTSFALNNSKDESFLSSENPNEENLEESSKPQRLKLALERAREYKKSLKLDQKQDPVVDSVVYDNGVVEDVSVVMGNEGIVGSDQNIDQNVNLEGEDNSQEQVVPEAVRRAMEKAKEYQKNKGVVNNGESNVENDNRPGGDVEVPETVRVSIEKVKEYKENKVTTDYINRNMENPKVSGSERGSGSNSGNRSIEQDTEKKGDLKLSSIDFVGLNFSDKKSGRGLPAGLVPVSDPFSDDALPEVEILVGDTTKFGNTSSSESKTSQVEEESSDLYKPKVSTWGMFPRPNNISKTFGGGRNIRPGEELESPEDRAAKEARTRKLIADYKRKMGLNMDPYLKAECEKALKEGDSLMDAGRLTEALPYYQTVMDKVAFQTQLHGLAALQWSICQDSLSRPEKAREMYEKLQSHPYVEVSKKARQFVFSFKAMEMMKVTRSKTPPKSTGYQRYFEAFVDDKPNYTSESTTENEDTLNQALLYFVFLASPILLVLLFATMNRV